MRVLGLLLLAGCGSVAVRKPFTSYVLPPPDRDQWAMLSMLQPEMLMVDQQMTYDATSRAATRVTYKYVNGHIPCDMPEFDNLCDGLYDPARRIVTVMYEPGQCLSETALGHEMVHVMLWDIRGVGDPKHRMREYWSDALTKANQSFCQLHCRGFCR